MAAWYQNVQLRRALVSAALWIVGLAVVGGLVWLVVKTPEPGVPLGMAPTPAGGLAGGAQAEIVFPDSAASDDEGVNRFIRHFLQTCREGRYEEYRNMVSIAQEPFAENKFFRAHDEVERIEITGIRRLANLRSPQMPPVVYLVRATVKLRSDAAEPRSVAILAFEEQAPAGDKKWVIYKPTEALVSAMEAETRPAEEFGSAPASPSDETHPPE